MNKEIEFFDSGYVSTEQTKNILPKSSEIKEFLKNPVPPELMIQYGTSKPTRVIIKAKITNG